MTALVAEPARARTPRTLPILSPSQLSALECPAKLAFKYVVKVDTPQNASAAAGTAIHALIEEFYKSGSLDMGNKYSPMANAARAWLPKFAERPSSEHVISGLPIGPGIFGGVTVGREMKIDLYMRDRTSALAGGFAIGPSENPWPTHDRAGRPIPLVIDLKTTGDERNKPTGELRPDGKRKGDPRYFMYQKTPEELRGEVAGAVRGKTDPQVLAYGKKAIVDFMETFGEMPEVIQMRWLYILRDAERPRCRASDFLIRPEEIFRSEELWSADIHTVHWIRSTDAKPEDVPKNLSMCGAYGGCPYSWRGLDLCPLTADEELRGSMPGEFPTLNEKMAAQMNAFHAQTQAALGVAPVAATATTPPSVAPAHFGTTPSAFAAPVPPTTPPAVPVPSAPPVAAPAPAAPVGPQFRTAGAAKAWVSIVGYFDQLRDDQKPQVVPWLRGNPETATILDDESAAELHAYIVSTMAPPVVAAPPPAPVVAAPPAPAHVETEAEAEVKRGRGRPKGSTNKPRPTEDAVVSAVANALSTEGFSPQFEARVLRALGAALRAAAEVLDPRGEV